MAFSAYKTAIPAETIKTAGIRFAVENRIFIIAESCVSLPLFAFCFFRLFSSLKLGQRPFINKTASATFGVYLIHDSPFGRSLIWNHILKVSDVQFASRYFPLAAVLDIVLVFSVCVLIDVLRQKYAEPLYLKAEETVTEKVKAVLFVRNKAQ